MRMVFINLCFISFTALSLAEFYIVVFLLGPAMKKLNTSIFYQKEVGVHTVVYIF